MNSRSIRRFAVPALVLVLAVGLAACGGHSESLTSPIPTPSPDTGVVAGSRIGPTEITFVSAEPPPGSTIAGCGTNASGCSGRVRMRFRLLDAAGGPVLYATGYLHGTTKAACYTGSTGGPNTSTGRLDLQPGVPAEVEIVFDQPDAAACPMPATIANMKVTLLASAGRSSLQEWAIRYEFRP